jgi:chromosome segregation ATPase
MSDEDSVAERLCAVAHEAVEALSEQEAFVKSQAEVIADKQNEIEENEGIISKLKARINEKNNAIKEKDDIIENLNGGILKLKAQIKEKNQAIKEKDAIIEDLNGGTEEKDETIQTMGLKIEAMEEIIDEKINFIDNVEGKLAEIERLRKAEVEKAEEEKEEIRILREEGPENERLHQLEKKLEVIGEDVRSLVHSVWRQDRDTKKKRPRSDSGYECNLHLI